MKRFLLFQNRFDWIALFCICLLVGTHGVAQAAAPMVKTQAPGYYRLLLGQFEITALCDGTVDLDKKLLLNASEPEIQRLLSRQFISGPKMKTSVNAYLINTGSKLVLVDTGTAKAFGPTLGYMLQNLKAAGYKPEQVDAVLITHMHGDHIGGLLDDAGKPVYKKASIYVHKADSDFFLSKEIAEKAPKDMQRFFKLARDVAAPYIASGQWKTFDDGNLPMTGIKAIHIPGHTPGHAAFEIRSDDQTLLIWGDLVHNMAVQFTNPAIALVFDTDQKKAVATRRTLFNDAADSKTLMAGSHMPFPGIGRVRAEGENTYAWVPVEY